MTAGTEGHSGEAQARRLESAVEAMIGLVQAHTAGADLRASPGEADWNTLQVLGHMVEMLPYWSGQIRRLMEAPGAPPPFGRTLEDPGRLAGVEHGATATTAELLSLLQDETRAAAAMIRGLSPEARAKTGIHPRRGEMSVNDIVEQFIIAHAEEHVEQVREALK